MYAGLLAIATIIFGIISRFYVYAEVQSDSLAEVDLKENLEVRF